jgi:ATP-dependent helicase Lhr and Lhr-like helicase
MLDTLPERADAPAACGLPPRFAAWFESRGWRPHSYQLEILDAAARRQSCLLIAPTGGGKTLAGFLPSLVELAHRGGGSGIHTLYVSPLKALTTDIARNLQAPVEEIGLPVRIESRTGDTPANRRQRQRQTPPDILLTTPESPMMFAGLRSVVVDELHALAPTKRGALLALGLARLRGFAPDAPFVGLSATVNDPPELLGWLSHGGRQARLIEGGPGPDPQVDILLPEARMPWAGHLALYALPALYDAIRRARTTLVFVNTRMQAELVFRELWRINRDDLPIALHHGSLEVELRRRVEAAMARGGLKAVVCTSSLDLGIDWGDVDLVVQIGAPKGVSRILQRIGRANHRFDEPSRALLVPGSRFEALECRAAIDAIREHTLDGDPARRGGLDVLAQHLIGIACCGPFDPDEIYDEIRQARPYAALPRRDFDDVLEFAASGGYALRVYDRYRRLRRLPDGRYRLAHPRFARTYRMNVGTIVEAPMLKVRLMPRRQVVGEVEEWFVQWLRPGDVFQFAGRTLEFQQAREIFADCRPAPPGAEPTVPSYMSVRMPFTTHLAERVRGYLADRGRWEELSGEVLEWLEQQERKSVLPAADELLIETFPRGSRWFLIAYGSLGRNAHQTLGMLLTKRMERRGLKPLGFVASDYMIAVWGLEPVDHPAALFDVGILGDDLEEWMAESSMLKRTFRNCAVVAGLIERRHPGQEKTGRQVTFNADLIYDVLRKHEPDHVLLRATRQEAAGGLMDVRRLADFLVGVQGSIRHRRLQRISPLAIPILLEMGKEAVFGEADEALLHEAAAGLVAEAMGEAPSAPPAP